MSLPAGNRLLPFLAATTCCAALVFSGCGGSSEPPADKDAADVQAIQKIGTEMTSAIRQNRLGAFCALVEPKGIKKSFGSLAKCKKQLEANLSKVKSEPTFSFSEVLIKDNSAVGLNEDDDGSTVFFTRVAGEWYMDMDPDNAELQKELDEAAK